jgi:hypothetical protein
VTGTVSRPGRGIRHPEVMSSAALAAQSAVKIAVSHEGWYRISAAQLLAAGLNVQAPLSSLRLVTEGTEVPIRVNQNSNTLTSIEFYGAGLDNPYTDTRMYWLIWGAGRGKGCTKKMELARPSHQLRAIWPPRHGVTGISTLLL